MSILAWPAWQNFAKRAPYWIKGFISCQSFGSFLFLSFYNSFFNSSFSNFSFKFLFGTILTWDLFSFGTFLLWDILVGDDFCQDLFCPGIIFCRGIYMYIFVVFLSWELFLSRIFSGIFCFQGLCVVQECLL